MLLPNPDCTATHAFPLLMLARYDRKEPRLTVAGVLMPLRGCFHSVPFYSFLACFVRVSIHRLWTFLLCRGRACASSTCIYLDAWVSHTCRMLYPTYSSCRVSSTAARLCSPGLFARVKVAQFESCQGVPDSTNIQRISNVRINQSIVWTLPPSCLLAPITLR